MNLIIVLKFAERKALGQFNDLAIVTLCTELSEMASPDGTSRWIDLYWLQFDG